MAKRIAGSAVLLLCALNAPARELKECVEVSVGSSGEATLRNVCTNMLNVMYCIDSARTARACSNPRRDVTTLAPGAAELVASYAVDGAGAVYLAVCAYPEAPVEWTPGPGGVYTCKKTCVMC
jgi:hypothetical protein